MTSPRGNATSAAPFVPPNADLPTLKKAAKGCRGCPLYRHATQTVFGEGDPAADMMLVGEIPGDKEDKEGRPFVGPAGGLLDKALAQIELDRSKVYVTNAVKHFKFILTGRYRLHRSPGGLEMNACRPWLEAELNVIRPKLVVSLGATAARALMGRPITITAARGKLFTHRYGGHLLMTIHPSAILRMKEEEERHAHYRQFVADLRKAKQYCDRLERPSLLVIDRADDRTRRTTINQIPKHPPLRKN